MWLLIDLEAWDFSFEMINDRKPIGDPADREVSEAAKDRKNSGSSHQQRDEFLFLSMANPLTAQVIQGLIASERRAGRQLQTQFIVRAGSAAARCVGCVAAHF